MLPRPNVITIRDWVHDPKRRKSRFRCQGCAKIIEDGAMLVIERRGKTSHGYHSDCFHASSAGASARSRDYERLFSNNPASGFEF